MNMSVTATHTHANLSERFGVRAGVGAFACANVFHE